MQTRKILVVDHEANARTALAELLRDEGFEVDTASDGVDALDKLREFDAELVITDLGMFGTNCSELISSLVHAPGAPSVIAMAAFRETATGVTALRAGARDYVSKPVDFDELLVVLGKVFEHHDLELEVQRLRADESTMRPISPALVTSRS